LRLEIRKGMELHSESTLEQFILNCSDGNDA